MWRLGFRHYCLNFIVTEFESVEVNPSSHPRYIQEIVLKEKEEEAVAAKLELMRSQKQATIDRMMATLARGNADLMQRVYKAWVMGMHMMIQERLKVKRFLQRILHSCAVRCMTFWHQKVMDRIWVRKFVERMADRRVRAAFKVG